MTWPHSTFQILEDLVERLGPHPKRSHALVQFETVHPDEQQAEDSDVGSGCGDSRGDRAADKVFITQSADVPFVSGADAVFLNAIPEPLIHSPPARRFGVDAPAMLPAASNALAAGFAAGLYDGSALDQQQAAQAVAQQAMTRQHAHGQPMIVVSNGLAMPPLLPQQLGAHTHPQDGASAAAAARARRASAAAAMGMQALGMDGDSSDALASLQAYVIGEDPWESLPASAAAVGPSGPQPPMMQLQVPQHQASLAPLSPQMLPGGGAMPMLMPTAPRAPRARRHSMFVSAGADPRAVRRGSVGNFDSNPALMQQLQQAAAAASLPAGAVFAPIQSGRATPNGYGGTGTPSGGVNAAALQMGLASAAIAERLAVLGLGDPAAGQLPAGGLLQQAHLAQSQPSLAAQMQVPLAQRQQAPPWAAAAAPGAAPHGGAFVAGAPRAPNAGSSRRHSWCPTGSVYFGPDGVRAARPGRGDQLAPMQMVDGSVGGTSGYTNLAASTSSYATPSQSSLHYSQPPSPLSSNGSAAAAAKAAGGVAQYAPAGAGAALAPDALGAAGPGGQLQRAC
ncbi:hypothetical protein MNEG_11540 [Monoraphidium neglectum]|uniref:Uncharacterized protein n=1 Tax=Monoraphidium neglectum TaxID=145388 RepID=A0A0D2KKX1_9CHLO|nr:hypothetical protein MNEG_11540 [Monoraphidium neglectum]KIY96423.1 hypothetical protein MNEG_11540 [Monoraphidium neglectum]|eukprot:XP_013895443.1 hypothetical protein MNEG_11540 [Monoraphidium neglectum]